MENRPRAIPEQFAALIEFMERHGDISRPQQGSQGRIKADRLWQELEEILNSIRGGAVRPLMKWKKVWADWKTKTKKKSLAMRREASGTGGGPSSRQTLTAAEERVLGIMGLSAVIGQAEIAERGFDAAPSEGNSLPPPTRDIVCPSPATDEIMLEFIPSYPLQATTASTAPPSMPTFSTPVQMPLPSTASAPMSSAAALQIPLLSTASAPMSSAAALQMPLLSTASAPMSSAAALQTPLPSTASAPMSSAAALQMPLLSTASAPMLSAASLQSPLPSTASAPMPSAASPTAFTSRGVPQRRRRHRESPSPAATPTTSTPRRRRLHQARARRIQTPFERATSEFVAVEHRRLQLEADRDNKYHEREVERLRLEAKRLEIESRKLDIDQQKNQILSRLGSAVDNLIEMLPQLRPSSLPSTEIIPLND